MFGRALRTSVRAQRRTLSESSDPMKQEYPTLVKLMHWVGGASLLGTVGCVKAAQWTEDKKHKGEYMMYHKSMALVTTAIFVPRLAIRLTTRLPAQVPGSILEHIGSATSHFALYALPLGLAASGITMGIFGGKGLPFFGITTIPGLENPRGDIAKPAFQAHKLGGQVLQYIIPIHIGAVGFHLAKGQNILKRML